MRRALALIAAGCTNKEVGVKLGVCVFVPVGV